MSSPGSERPSILRYVTAWVVCLNALVLAGNHAWIAFGDSRRRDGNYGHTAIDFGGQWLMGALFVQGHGPHLYHRNQQRQVLLRAMPYEDEVPDEERLDPDKRDPDMSKGKRDADKLMSWLMGVDRQETADTFASFLTPLAAPDPLGATLLLTAGQGEWAPERVQAATAPVIGGPLYPPVNALYTAPFGLLEPHIAYRVNQMLCLVWALLAGLGISYLTRGKFWWPIATILILIYPGCKGSILLAQNSLLTLVILVWGWALLTRKHPIAGGMVWGLLAFKPVWAATFFLVPLVTGRPRFCLAMLGTGAFLGLLTLPFVGFQPWLEWLYVGREAAALYNIDQNWVFLSRDLLGIPRRWMLDFSLPSEQRDRIEAALAGWALWGIVLTATLLLAFLRRKQLRQTTGPAPAFLFLAAWMLCFHFMYYDVLLSVLPFFLLCAEPRRFLEPTCIAFLPLSAGHLGAEVASYYRPGLPEEYPEPVPLVQAGHRHLLVLNRMVPNVLLLLLAVEHLFGPLGLGVSLTGFWSPEPREATIQWEATTGEVETATQIVTTTGKWPEHPFKVASTPFMEGQPWDTYVLIFLWMWCGVLLLRSVPDQTKFELAPDSVVDVILVPVD